MKELEGNNTNCWPMDCEGEFRNKGLMHDFVSYCTAPFLLYGVISKSNFMHNFVPSTKAMLCHICKPGVCLCVHNLVFVDLSVHISSDHIKYTCGINVSTLAQSVQWCACNQEPHIDGPDSWL